MSKINQLFRLWPFRPGVMALILGTSMIGIIAAIAAVNAGVADERRDSGSETVAMVENLQSQIREIGRINDKNQFMAELLKFANKTFGVQTYLNHGGVIPLEGGAYLKIVSKENIIVEAEIGPDASDTVESHSINLGDVIGINSSGMVTDFDKSTANALQTVVVGTAEGVAIINIGKGTISIVGPPLDK